MSARHCEVAIVGAGVAVHDLGSRNGTYVGGARVKEALGTEGTTIAIGQTTLVCVAIDDEDDDELAEPLPGDRRQLEGDAPDRGAGAAARAR